MSILNPETFLELTKRLAYKCQESPDSITSVATADGQAFEFFAFINQACLDIYRLHDTWSFMLQSPGVSFQTVAGQQFYTPAQAGVSSGSVASWVIPTFRTYQTSVGIQAEIEMLYVDYMDWVQTYYIGTTRTTQTQPLAFTITPEKNIAVQCPLPGYTITADYYLDAIPLVNDTDQPRIPVVDRMVIVYRAMMAYGSKEAAPEIYSEGQDNYNRMLMRMRRRYLPKITLNGPL